MRAINRKIFGKLIYWAWGILVLYGLVVAWDAQDGVIDGQDRLAAGLLLAALFMAIPVIGFFASSLDREGPE